MTKSYNSLILWDLISEMGGSITVNSMPQLMELRLVNKDFLRIYCNKVFDNKQKVFCNANIWLNPGYGIVSPVQKIIYRKQFVVKYIAIVHVAWLIAYDFKSTGPFLTPSKYFIFTFLESQTNIQINKDFPKPLRPQPICMYIHKHYLANTWKEFPSSSLEGEQHSYPIFAMSNLSTRMVIFRYVISIW